MFGTMQREENKTGLPDNLKNGMESFSGMSLDHVKVHYNSSKPASVQAHAYAQGSDIHIASGQEKHLPHELGHVVQQAEGRVKPTTNIAGIAVNDNQALESEATRMGARALQMKSKNKNNFLSSNKNILQAYRDFNKANGANQYDYKIVNGNDPKFGKYHIKFHNYESLGVFDEIHIVFEGYDRTGYFFYTDAGILINQKSSGLKLKDESLNKKAQELINQQLSTSDIIDNKIVQEKLLKREEQRKKDEEQKKKWKEEDKQKELLKKEDELKQLASKDLMAKKLHEAGLLKIIVDNNIPFYYFAKFTLKDSIEKWGVLKPYYKKIRQLLANDPLLSIKEINLDISNYNDLNTQQQKELVSIIQSNGKKVGDYILLPSNLLLPNNIFGAGAELVYDEDDKTFDIFYDVKEN